jgi:5-oxopent-3-ene-1,2,5-tricarboxylate decarboxylase / 2-hydroxyhepta-2,4-diene-1,7-dioate isomerase
MYGVLLNFRGDLESFGERLHSPPYLAPPRAPILYVKPRNTFGSAESDIAMPTESAALQAAATLGIVFGRTATRVSPDEALSCIGGLVALAEVAVAHEEVFRPALRQRCRDGFTPLGPQIVDFDPARLAELRLRTHLNGTLQSESTLEELVRPIPVLISDISQFMSLRAGDVLSLGMPRRAPRARAGDVLVCEVPGVGRLENRVVTESAWSTEP